MLQSAFARIKEATERKIIENIEGNVLHEDAVLIIIVHILHGFFNHPKEKV